MNKKGGAGVVTWFLTVAVFISIWGLGLGKKISDFGELMVATNSLTGIEAFFAHNINLVIFIAIAISTAVITTLGRGEN